MLYSNIMATEQFVNSDCGAPALVNNICSVLVTIRFIGRSLNISDCRYASPVDCIGKIRLEITILV